MSRSEKQLGFGLLIGGAVLAVLMGAGIVAWLVDAAAHNPDVRTERPGWLDAASGFDVSFWIPLIVTFGGGILLVAYVFVRAARRMRSGEDLYGTRYGRGVRRRGERHVSDPGATEAGLVHSGEERIE